MNYITLTDFTMAKPIGIVNGNENEGPVKFSIYKGNPIFVSVGVL